MCYNNVIDLIMNLSNFLDLYTNLKCDLNLFADDTFLYYFDKMSIYNDFAA